MDGRRGLKRACSGDDEPEYSPKKKRGRPPKKPKVGCWRADSGEIHRCGANSEGGRGRPPGGRKSLPVELTLEKCNAAEGTPAETPKVVYTVVNTLWEARRKGKSSNKGKQDSPVGSNSVADLLGFLTGDDDDANDSTHIYVLIHNIDGPGLRDDDVQQTLASLAGSKHVRLVASMVNINGPILWDKQMARNQFKWLWLHTLTYTAYKLEGTCVPLLLAAGAATKSARSAILVLRSLTPNAQSVFRVLGEFQINHPDDQGLPFNRLYTACREQFLVSSEVTLRGHLTEFKDHELLKLRRGVDGQDCLYIPLPNEALSKLLEDITS